MTGIPVPLSPTVFEYGLAMVCLVEIIDDMWKPTPDQAAEFERLISKPHVVRGDETFGRPDDMRQWCRKAGIWCRTFSPEYGRYPMLFQFGRAEDEILFRLRWGGQSA